MTNDKIMEEVMKTLDEKQFSELLLGKLGDVICLTIQKTRQECEKEILQLKKRIIAFENNLILSKKDKEDIEKFKWDVLDKQLKQQEDDTIEKIERNINENKFSLRIVYVLEQLKKDLFKVSP